jgi:hypothetical protein
VILEEFVEWMQPSELRFDKLQLWARVLNLPFNLRNPTWGKAIAKMIDKEASQVMFDSVGGFLRARVTIDVTKPLRRGLLIESAARKSTDWYVIQYEHIPHFCFSCGRLGHSELLCPTPGIRDADGNWPFGAGLRAPDERKKAGPSENSSRDQSASQNSKRDTKSSSTTGDAGVEMKLPSKQSGSYKRKGGGSRQVYLPVGTIQPAASACADLNANKQMIPFSAKPGESSVQLENTSENESNKKRKTPSNSENLAEAVMQPCQSQ